MNGTHNPMRQVGYLQQCLSSDKKPLGIFLGAGCPMAVRSPTDGKPLIPDIAGLTTIIRDEMTKADPFRSLITAVDQHFTRDGRSGITVEDMLTHIRALRAVAGRDEVRGLSAENLEKIDDEICRHIHARVDKTLPNTETPYHRIAAWVDAVRRDNPVEVFTTNYDLLMEQAFEDCRVPYFDGFAGVRRPFFDLRAMEEDMLPPRWARLWKLHGSVNWHQVPDKGVFRGAAEDKAKRVIHPSHLKYQESRRMPYLAMIDRLRAFLKQPTATLILCGYSFRDEHINEVIIQGLQCTHTATAFALLFDGVAGYPQAAALASQRPNLILLCRDGGVISGQQAKWPEKEEEAVSADNTRWVRWTPTDPGSESDKRTAEFTLGDFAVFGQFLEELVGNTARMQEAPNAQ